jgi:hypothetical protein
MKAVLQLAGQARTSRIAVAPYISPLHKINPFYLNLISCTDKNPRKINVYPPKSFVKLPQFQIFSEAGKKIRAGIAPALMILPEY